MKRQGNIQQVKEHDKNTPNQTKEEEIEVTWRRKGRVKKGDSNQASNQIPK